MEMKVYQSLETGTSTYVCYSLFWDIESDFSETKLYIWEFDAYYYVMLLLATAMQYVKLTKSIQEPPLLP